MAASADDIADLIAQAYHAALDLGRWEPFLDGLRAITHATAASLVFQDVGREASGAVRVRPLDRQSVGLDPTYVRLYSETPDLVRANPWNAHLSPTGPVGHVTRSHQVVSDAALERTDFFQAILRPQRLRYGINLIVGRDGGVQTSVNAVRGRGAGPFDDREVRTLRLLGGHVRRATEMARRLRTTWVGADTLRAALDLTPAAVFLVDAGAHVLALNGAAEDLARRADGIVVGRDHRLAAGDSRTTGALRCLVADVALSTAGAGLSAGDAIPLPRRAGAWPLVALVSPLSRRHLALATAGVAAVVVSERETEPNLDTRMLRQVFDLTRAEATVASELVAGRTLAQASRRLGIMPQTARTHLKRVFSKTGVTRQAELVRLLLPLARSREG
jgi:DNA-binding CsgD family transcriptional regulator/PAS domain-containing protein